MQDQKKIKYYDGIDTSKVSFYHEIPFTRDDFEDPYEDYEPDGRDLAEMNNYKDEDESF